MKADTFTFDDFQLAARKFQMAPSDLRWAHAIVGVAAESGELADLMEKGIRSGDLATRIDGAAMIEEAGDVLWYLAEMADALNISLAEIAEANLKKLAARHPLEPKPTAPDGPLARSGKRKKTSKRKAK